MNTDIPLEVICECKEPLSLVRILTPTPYSLRIEMEACSDCSDTNNRAPAQDIPLSFACDNCGNPLKVKRVETPTRMDVVFKIELCEHCRESIDEGASHDIEQSFKEGKDKGKELLSDSIVRSLDPIIRKIESDNGGDDAGDLSELLTSVQDELEELRRTLQ